MVPNLLLRVFKLLDVCVWLVGQLSVHCHAKLAEVWQRRQWVWIEVLKCRNFLTELIDH